MCNLISEMDPVIYTLHRLWVATPCSFSNKLSDQIQQYLLVIVCLSSNKLRTVTDKTDNDKSTWCRVYVSLFPMILLLNA